MIPTFNGAQVIRDQLDSIARQNGSDGIEVIVSDNGSTDGTLDLVRPYAGSFGRLTVLDSSSRRGVAHARNAGAEAATGDAIIFCDQDDVVGAEWLAAMRSALVAHPFVAARLDHRRLNPGWTRQYFGEPQAAGLANTTPPYLPYAWGGTIGVHRDIHIATGGFDESFGQGGEDNDYCYRLQRSGTPLTFVPGAVIHYRHRQRLSAIYEQSHGYGLASARVLKRYQDRGMGRPSQLRAIGAWISLPLLTPVRVRSQAGRARLVSRLGWRVGRLEGSIKDRVLCL